MDGHGCVFVAYRQFSSNSTPGVSLAVRSPLATKWTPYPVDHTLFHQSRFPSALAVSGGSGGCGTPTIALSNSTDLSVATLTADSEWDFSIAPQLPTQTAVALAASDTGLYLCVPSLPIGLYFLADGAQEWTFFAKIETTSINAVALAVVDDAIFVSYMNSSELHLVQVDPMGEQVELLMEERKIDLSPSSSPLLAADQNGVVVGTVFTEENGGSSIRLWEIDYIFENSRNLYSFPPILTRVPISATLSISVNEAIVSVIKSAEIKGSRWEASESFGFVVGKNRRRPQYNAKTWTLNPVDVPGPHGSIASALVANELWISLMETGFQQLAELKVLKLQI